MTILQAVILGLIQGLTEFLPVSSSGHLLIAEKLMGVSSDSLAFEIFLHLATLLAVVIVMRRQLLKLLKALFTARLAVNKGRLQPSSESLRLLLILVVSTIPAALAGYAFRHQVEHIKADPHYPVYIAACLLVTGCILFGTRFAKRRAEPITWWRGLIIGCCQAVAALFRGISRSGSTIAGGVYCGVGQEQATEFSFLLSVPVILGAALLKLKDLRHEGLPAAGLGAYLAGGLAALVSGYVAILLLLKVVKKNRLDYFAYYCWAMGLASLVWFLGH
ncbi:MAG TPA: undecaprenyl-diphosphate phosphatase [Candidatus Edwardsbacteria bacterium]|nr:undecaprenyl-diphosphate phosphatase [Candidatus Edwardsbacteria bacterium]